MAYCETCGINVRKERLRECVLNGHKIIWNYHKRGVPTERMRIKDIQKIEQMKKIAQQIAKLMPPEKLKEIEEARKEIEKELEALLCKAKHGKANLEVMLNEKMERGPNNQRV